jgi:type III pantothenate kinase
MNLIAIDIGNTNIKIGLFLDDTQKFIVSIKGSDTEQLFDCLMNAWGQVPFAERANDPVRDGIIIVSSVKPEWTETIEKMCADSLGEKIKLVGRDIKLPMEMGVDDYRQVGTDRVVAAAAAYAVVQDAVVVADFGSAVTIDLVDEQGVFMGGVIAPGFGIAAKSLADNTAQLPMVEVKTPTDPIGANTNDAINAGLYFSAVGLLRAVIEKYAEQIGKWPQTIVTGADAAIIKKDCDFVDTWVSDLTVTGIVLAYKKYLNDQAELEQYDKEDAGQFDNDSSEKE